MANVSIRDLTILQLLTIIAFQIVSSSLITITTRSDGDLDLDLKSVNNKSVLIKLPGEKLIATDELVEGPQLRKVKTNVTKTDGDLYKKNAGTGTGAGAGELIREPKIFIEDKIMYGFLTFLSMLLVASCYLCFFKKICPCGSRNGEPEVPVFINDIDATAEIQLPPQKTTPETESRMSSIV